MAVTIKQIADHAGLSVPTVSRILNNDSQLFRAETRDKVLKSASELGYRPNSYRMALRTKRFNSIGLLFTADTSLSCLSCETQTALLGELARRNQHLVAGQAGLSAAIDDATLPKMLREWSVDGLLIDTTAATPLAVEELIHRTKIPAIWLNSRRDADCVYPDEFAGAKAGVERLLDLGHRRVMYLDLGDRGRHFGPDRQAGYEAAMKAAGLTPQALTPAPVEKADRAAFLSEWIRANRGRDFPTAVFCSGVDQAMPLYVAAVQAGLSVPRDLSILTIHDQSADALGLRLTQMRLPAAELALVGLTALDEKILNPTVDVPPCAVPLIYEEGATLAPVKKGS